MSTNPRKTTVEPKGSKEFHPDRDVITVEVVHAARVLEDFFTMQGYDEWIFMGICSRKLMEKVQKRDRVPQYTAHPSMLHEAVTMATQAAQNSIYEPATREAVRVVNHDGTVITYPAVPDEGIRVGPPPEVLDPRTWPTPDNIHEVRQHFQARQEMIDQTHNTASEVHAQAVLRDIQRRATDQERAERINAENETPF